MLIKKETDMNNSSNKNTLTTVKDFFRFIFNRDIRNIFITWNIVSLWAIVIIFIKDYNHSYMNEPDIFFLFLPYISLFIFLTVLIPSSIIMFTASKYIKSKTIKATIWAFIIPFITMIYYLIPNEQISDFAISLGFFTLPCVYPQLFISTLIIPKKYCSNKWDYFISVTLTILFAFILMFLSISIKYPFTASYVNI